MLIDDETLILNTLSRFLKWGGYSLCALEADGEQALNNIEGAKPDLVIMEILMHGAMNGIEMADRIRQRWDIPILFLTKCMDESILKKAESLEASHVVHKLTPITEISEKIERLLEKPLKRNRIEVRSEI